MPILLSSSSTIPSFHCNHLKVHSLGLERFALPDQNCPCLHFRNPQKLCFAKKNISIVLKHKLHSTSKCVATTCMNSSNEFLGEESEISSDWRDQGQEGIGDMESPWEGVVVYQRNPSISHVECCTTLERLGLGKLSSEVSRSRASLMGLRVTKDVKDFPLGTPVLISIDVTRKKQKLRLDGIIRTVITLGCNRCGEPAAESVFSNFSLLLTEDPIEEPEIINMGVIFGEDKFRTFTSNDEDESNEDSIDLDDWLYFPPEEKTIDISKHIRDAVHLEITINALCDPTCKGLCLNCGTNLNTGSCDCSNRKVKEKGYGPLGGLRKQMQQN